MASSCFVGARTGSAWSVLITALFIISLTTQYETFAQTPPSAPSAETPSAVQRSPKARKPLPANDTSSEAHPPSESLWLPPWPSPSFDWAVQPEIGARYEDNGDTKSSQMEFGLGLDVQGIPLSPGNPGATLAVNGGYALGNQTQKREEEKAKSGLYHRLWAGARVPILLGFFKSKPGLRFGQINGKLTSLSRTGAFEWDNGVLVLPFFATHYTFDASRLYGKDWTEFYYKQYDHWLSFRFFTPILNARLAFGPAFTQTKVQNLYTVNQTSLRALAGSDLFWKLRLTAHSRYILSNEVKDSKLLGKSSSSFRSPEKSLNEPDTILTSPRGTWDTTLFLGIKNLIGGLGVGYRYRVQVSDFETENGKRRESREQSGFGVFYEATI
jgi:hypothetical protein